MAAPAGPQPGGSTAAPTTAGPTSQGPTPGSGAASKPFPKPAQTRVILCLHNLVNVPPEVTKTRGAGPFSIEVTAVALAKGGNVAPVRLETVKCEVSTAMIEEGDEGRLEVKLSSSVDWAINYEPTVIGVNIVIKERDRIVGQAAPMATGGKFALQINLDDVLRRKLITRIVGMRMGQLGVSVGVSPRDKEGYHHRLDTFLRHYNPKSLDRIDGVLKAVSELATFTKLFRKYKVVDYEERGSIFYSMYGPEHLSALKAALTEWENKEELFMQSLCLDNGPEPSDIDLRRRLIAFSEHHNTRVDVEGLAKAHQETPHVLFKQLVQAHGQEPDPRTYLFPPTVYESEAAAAQRAATSGGGGTPGNAAPPPGTARLVDTNKPGDASPSQAAPGAGTPSGNSGQQQQQGPGTGSQPANVQPQRLSDTDNFPLPTASPAGSGAGAGAGGAGSKRQSISTLRDSKQPTPGPQTPLDAQDRPPSYNTLGGTGGDTAPAPSSRPAAAQHGSGGGDPANENFQLDPKRQQTPQQPSVVQQQPVTQGPTTPAKGRPVTAAATTSGNPAANEGIASALAKRSIVRNTNTASGAGGPRAGPPGASASTLNAAANAAPGGGDGGNFHNIVELWSTFLADLRNVGVPSTELYYLDEESFLSLLGEMKYDQAARLQLVHEWDRRVTASLRTEYATPQDNIAENVKRDVVSLSGMSPLCLQLAGVAALTNAEHESAFTMRLGNAKLRATERLIYIGEHTALMDIALRGFSPSPGTAKYMGFPKRPFNHVDRPTTVSALVCDVVVGKPLVTVMDAPPANQDFFDQYDSVMRFVNTERQESIVYSPQQVLPRFIVHITVDPTIMPCPGHPTKPVEYFLVESGAFACSQCVVMGPHRGKEVITVDEAATRAKSELLELARHAGIFSAEVGDQEQHIQRQLQQLTVSEVRQNAIREAEQIRREAERRATDILQAAEQETQQAQSRLSEDQKEMGQVRDEVNHVLQKLERAQGVSSGMRSLELLSQLKEGNELERIRARYDATRGQNNQGGAAGGGFRAATPRSTSNSVMAQDGGGHSTNASAKSRGELYAKFAGIKTEQSGAAPHPLVQQTPTSARQFGAPNHNASVFADQSLSKMGPNASSILAPGNPLFGQSGGPGTPGVSYPSGPGGAHGNMGTEPDVREQMKRGWAAYRNGDREQAQTLWMSIYERHQDNAVGARARAYVAEAIEKDYNNAAVWYEKALRIDPNDYMTLFNYGVLLESVLGKRREALTFFEAAARLGDQTAARRAEVLQQQLGLRQQ